MIVPIENKYPYYPQCINDVKKVSKMSKNLDI